jgi:flavodoxin
MTSNFTRRTVLTAPALLSMAATAAYAQPTAASQGRGSKTLVAYFTRSGNTKVVAGTIHRGLGTDLFEIRPASPYPEDYEQTVEQARQERDSGYEPVLAATVSKIANYDTLFLCFPIWGETAPPVIRSFLRAHDLSGKTLRPVITHGGFGLGDSLAVVTEHAPRARIEPAFSMEADQERRTLNRVTSWLGEVGLR